MSRLDAQVHEENRKANLKTASFNARQQKVMAWLKKNPHIGQLNNGNYYKIVDGKAVTVKEFGQ